jgi:hypothetical protein
MLPKAVVNVLDAVKFLVSAGDCFVVIGLARDFVERSIRVQLFRTEQIVDSREPAEDPNEKATHRLRQRSADYLNRLISVEVALPAPNRHSCCPMISLDHHTR